MRSFFCFCAVDAMCMGSLFCLADGPPFIAICVDLVASCVFDTMCMGFFIGLADRSPLVAICVLFCLCCFAHGFFVGLADRLPFVDICVCACFVIVFEASNAIRAAFVA